MPLRARRDAVERLDVEDQARALGARDARHDLAARLAFFRAEESVAVVRFAVEQSGHACAANALLARGRDPDAMLRERIHDALVGRNRIGAAALPRSCATKWQCRFRSWQACSSRP